MRKGSISLDSAPKWMTLSIFKTVAGMDATTVFHDIGHSTEAKKILSKYFIGELREVSYYIRDIKF